LIPMISAPQATAFSRSGWSWTSVNGSAQFLERASNSFTALLIRSGDQEIASAHTKATPYLNRIDDKVLRNMGRVTALLRRGVPQGFPEKSLSVRNEIAAAPASHKHGQWRNSHFIADHTDGRRSEFNLSNQTDLVAWRWQP